MPFSKGDILCDHGQLISESEGKALIEEQQEAIYLFFIKGKGGAN